MRKIPLILSVLAIAVLIFLNEKIKHEKCNKSGSLAEKINFGRNNCNK